MRWLYGLICVIFLLLLLLYLHFWAIQREVLLPTEHAAVVRHLICGLARALQAFFDRVYLFAGLYPLCAQLHPVYGL